MPPRRPLRGKPGPSEAQDSGLQDTLMGNSGSDVVNRGPSTSVSGERSINAAKNEENHLSLARNPDHTEHEHDHEDQEGDEDAVEGLMDLDADLDIDTDDQPTVEGEAPIPADDAAVPVPVLIPVPAAAAGRPARKAAREATKKMDAAKAQLERGFESDDEDMKEDDDVVTSGEVGGENKGKSKGKGKESAKEGNEEVQATSSSKSKSKGKGKGKEKQVQEVPGATQAEDSDGGPEFGKEANTSKGIKGTGKGKKTILAKAVYWKDIPKWKEGDRSYLMEMPAEIMDQIFGLRKEIGIPEYVALAGTCKYFRHHMNDDFFEAVFREKVPKRTSGYDKISVSHRREPSSNLRRAAQPFTRDIEEWRVDRPRRYLDPNQSKKEKEKEAEQKKTKDKHYVPRGDRSTWTEAQYTVYKEEKQRYQDANWKTRKIELRALVIKLKEEEERRDEWVLDDKRNRNVLAVVEGRKHGQPPVQKDQKGLPVVETDQKAATASEQDDDAPVNGTVASESSSKDVDMAEINGDVPASNNESSPDAPNGKRSGAYGRKRRSEGTDTTSTAPSSFKPRVKKPRTRKSGSIWVVPDESDDDDPAYDEIEFMKKQGSSVIHDHWPSQWRASCVHAMQSQRISKTTALSEYKVTEAELLTLRHVLVPNSMSFKQPTQLYYKAAVEALAYRAHGGVEKHKAHVQRAKDSATGRAERKKIRKEEAIANGTWVHKFKARPGSFWDNYWGLFDNHCYCDECWCHDCDRWLRRAGCLGCGRTGRGYAAMYGSDEDD